MVGGLSERPPEIPELPERPPLPVYPQGESGPSILPPFPRPTSPNPGFAGSRTREAGFARCFLWLGWRSAAV